jgi:ADP-ribosyl-[dinitrogen reductase] hydrolase
MKTLDTVKGALFGLAIGDALGVPVEFKSREELKRFPVKGMRAFGSWNQPQGTWSDDSSLAFCLVESLCTEYNLDDIAEKFIQWKANGYWGAHHKVFDIGGATRFAIDRLIKGTSPLLSGGMNEDDNGNGSLMRILPLLFYIQHMPQKERYQRIKEVSSITHAHFRSVFSCFIYIEMALLILNKHSIEESYLVMQKTVKGFAKENEFNIHEVKLFSNLLEGNIAKQKEKNIHSGGYVLNTLEASIWCLLNTGSYKDAVLKAVNLGGDTDTTACVTGGLAGLFYGYKNIPQDWVQVIARYKDIENLCEQLNRKFHHEQIP